MPDIQSIRKIISKILKLKENDLNPSFDLVTEYGMDSMQRVEIIIEIEKIFDIEIPDEEGLGLRTLEKIEEYVQAKINVI